MRIMSIAIVVGVGAALAQAGTARAGHEWTDGTFGPPGQSYDTAMPIFPSAKKSSPKPSDAPSQTCNSRAPTNAGTGTGRDSDRQHQSTGQPTTAANGQNTCRTP